MTLKEAVRDFDFWFVDATEAQKQQAEQYWLSNSYGPVRWSNKQAPYVALRIADFTLYPSRPYREGDPSSLLFPSIQKFRDAIDALAQRTIIVPLAGVDARRLVFYAVPGGLYLSDVGYIANADFVGLQNYLLDVNAVDPIV